MPGRPPAHLQVLHGSSIDGRVVSAKMDEFARGREQGPRGGGYQEGGGDRREYGGGRREYGGGRREYGGGRRERDGVRAPPAPLSGPWGPGLPAPPLLPDGVVVLLGALAADWRPAACAWGAGRLLS